MCRTQGLHPQFLSSPRTESRGRIMILSVQWLTMFLTNRHSTYVIQYRSLVSKQQSNPLHRGEVCVNSQTFWMDQKLWNATVHTSIKTSITNLIQCVVIHWGKLYIYQCFISINTSDSSNKKFNNLIVLLGMHTWEKFQSTALHSPHKHSRR